MRESTRVGINRTRAGLTVLLLVAASFLLGSCSSKQPEGKLDKSSGAAPQAAAGSVETSFDVLAAWRPKRVVIKTSSMQYTMTPKAGAGFIALEMALKSENRDVPVPANFTKVVLVDSKGGRHDPLFSYPSSLSTYAPNEDSILFSDEPDKLIGGRLSELGGKAILVFDIPRKSTGFKVEIAGASPVAVELKP